MSSTDDNVIRTAKWYISVPEDTTNFRETISVSKGDKSWELFVKDVNIGDTVLAGSLGSIKFSGVVDSVCTPDNSERKTVFSRTIKDIKEIEDGKWMYLEDPDQELFALMPIVHQELFRHPDCPNCGYTVPLMSHGICSDCEDERRYDKYVYCN